MRVHWGPAVLESLCGHWDNRVEMSGDRGKGNGGPWVQSMNWLPLILTTSVKKRRNEKDAWYNVIMSHIKQTK